MPVSSAWTSNSPRRLPATRDPGIIVTSPLSTTRGAPSGIAERYVSQPGRIGALGLDVYEEEADLFLTYCTNAVLAAREVPSLEVIQVPSTLSVGASYGLIVLSQRAEAARLALFLLSEEGQSILASHGFDAPLLGKTN